MSRRAALLDEVASRTHTHVFTAPNLEPFRARPPVSESELDEAEAAIGYPLPPLFRELYAKVADGVWPGTDSLEEIVDLAAGRTPASGPWPKPCLSFYAWGCGIQSCVDLRSKRARVVRFDPHFQDVLVDPENPSPTHVPAYAPFLMGGHPLLFRKESDSLEDWFDAWLEGHSVSELQGMSPQAARRVERELANATKK